MREIRLNCNIFENYDETFLLKVNEISRIVLNMNRALEELDRRLVQHLFVFFLTHARFLKKIKKRAESSYKKLLYSNFPTGDDIYS